MKSSTDFRNVYNNLEDLIPHKLTYLIKQLSDATARITRDFYQCVERQVDSTDCSVAIKQMSKECHFHLISAPFLFFLLFLYQAVNV